MNSPPQQAAGLQPLTAIPMVSPLAAPADSGDTAAC
jgi:hypothetical protein